MVPIYDQMLFTGKPDLTSFGLRNGKIYYEANLFPVDEYDEPNEAKVREAAGLLNASGYPTDWQVALDVEFWNWYVTQTTPELATQAMDYLIQIIDWFRDEAPTYEQIGFYGMAPNREYWPAQDSSSTDYQTWQVANDFNAPLLVHCHAMYPSLYTFYNDRPTWAKYANANIAEARRNSNGKPVYPYLWPEYHEGGDLHGTYIDYDFWTLQLQTVDDLADGIIIWGDQNAWNGSAEWWQATQDFIAAKAADNMPQSGGLKRTGFQCQS